MTTQETEQSSKRLLKWGWAITAAYGAFLAIMGWSASDQLFTQNPSQFGDLLAGVFSPLAFLWLVLGFMQQGEELRHSSAALRLQGEELQHSVEQQKDLVAVTREQLEFEREERAKAEVEVARAAMPTLVLSVHRRDLNPGDIHLYKLRLLNTGTPCTNLKILRDNRILVSLHAFPPQMPKDFPLGFHGPVNIDITLLMRFTNSRGKRSVQQFVLKPYGDLVPSQLEVTSTDPELETLPAAQVVELPLRDPDPS